MSKARALGNLIHATAAMNRLLEKFVVWKNKTVYFIGDNDELNYGRLKSYQPIIAHDTCSFEHVTIHNTLLYISSHFTVLSDLDDGTYKLDEHEIYSSKEDLFKVYTPVQKGKRIKYYKTS